MNENEIRDEIKWLKSKDYENFDDMVEANKEIERLKRALASREHRQRTETRVRKERNQHRSNYSN